MDACDLGLEYEADVRPKGRLRPPFKASSRCERMTGDGSPLQARQGSVRQAARVGFANRETSSAAKKGAGWQAPVSSMAAGKRFLKESMAAVHNTISLILL